MKGTKRWMTCIIYHRATAQIGDVESYGYSEWCYAVEQSAFLTRRYCFSIHDLKNQIKIHNKDSQWTEINANSPSRHELPFYSFCMHFIYHLCHQLQSCTYVSCSYFISQEISWKKKEGKEKKNRSSLLYINILEWIHWYIYCESLVKGIQNQAK